MNPLRRRAAVFSIAALKHYPAMADAHFTHSEAIKHSKLTISELQQQAVADHCCSSVTPKHAQKALQVSQKHLRLVYAAASDARKLNTHHLFLVLPDPGQLTEYGAQLSASYLLVQP